MKVKVKYKRRDAQLTVQVQWPANATGYRLLRKLKHIQIKYMLITTQTPYTGGIVTRYYNKVIKTILIDF